MLFNRAYCISVFCISAWIWCIHISTFSEITIDTLLQKWHSQDFVFANGSRWFSVFPNFVHLSLLVDDSFDRSQAIDILITFKIHALSTKLKSPSYFCQDTEYLSWNQSCNTGAWQGQLQSAALQSKSF